MRRVVSAVLLSTLSLAVMADDAAKTDDHAKAKKTKFVVDMADGLDFNNFHNDKDAEAVYSTEFALPWKRKDAVNAYHDAAPAPKPAAADSKAATRNGGTFVAETPAKASATVMQTAAPASAAEESKAQKTEETAKLEPGTPINIRVRYSLQSGQTEQYSPATAVNALFSQMAAHCQYGFLKMSEWSTPVAGSTDFYLYYQFQCMPKE